MSQDKERIRVRCPQCRTKYRVPATKAGRSVRCSECQTKFRIPTIQAPSRHVPTEEDILKWLNEGNDDDYIAPRPRVAKVPIVPRSPSADDNSRRDSSPGDTSDRNHPANPASRLPQHDMPRDVLNDPMIFRKTG